MKTLKYRGYKLKVVDTQDSFWVSFENKNFQDCTERFNDETSAIDGAKRAIDILHTPGKFEF